MRTAENLEGPTDTTLDAARFEAAMTGLVVEIPPGMDLVLDEYRASDSGDATYSTSIQRQVRAFLLYRKYAETGKRFLDWGCRFAWDSCMVRMVNKDAVIDGCDISDEMSEPTKAFARLKYTPLTHQWNLPYEDATFDRIICSGVLEHVPFPSASLHELNRVMQSDGILVVTFLPNKWSYTEFSLRHFFKHSQHRRLYSRSQLKQLLLDHGFEPIESGYHQLLPSLTVGHKSLPRFLSNFFRTIFKHDAIAERIWPFRLLCANVYAIARKRDYM